MPYLKSSSRILLLFFLVYFSYFWLNVGQFDEAGNFFMRQGNIWADWALHFTIGSAFAERSLWLSENPLMIHSQISYPPLTGWLAAILLKLGVPFFAAFIIPSYIFSILIVLVLFLFFKILLKSQKMAVMASLLYLLNGGWGFIYYFADLAKSTDKWRAALFPLQEYTDMQEKGIHFMSFLTSMIYPQRAFTVGFPLVLGALAIVLFLLVLKKKVNERYRGLLLATATIIIGISPIIHPHAALAAAIILLSWFVFQLVENWRGKNLRQKLSRALRASGEWLAVGSGALIIALVLLVVFLAGSVENKSSFITLNPGFMSAESNYPLLIYWLVNWGFVPILGILGLLILFKTKQATHQATTKIVLPFFLIFLSANIWQFQPWIWDNMKLLAWSAVGIVAATAIAIQKIWEKPGVLPKLVAALIFLSCIFSGSLELLKNLQFSRHHYLMYSAEELALTAWVKNHTPKDSVWLTSTVSNNWAYNLTGRQTVLAYPGWLASHGYDVDKTMTDHAQMMRSPETSLDLFAKYQVTYIAIGPREIEQHGADPEKFNRLFTSIKTTSNYTIFQIEN